MTLLAAQTVRALNKIQGIAWTSAPRLLIVEDNAEYAVQLMNDLKSWRVPLANAECDVDIALTTVRAEQFLAQDSIDIFIVDLLLDENQPKNKIGEDFIRRVVATSNAGIIIHTSLSADDAEAAKLLNEGADDYIRKGSQDLETIRSRISALWRRIQSSRPKGKLPSIHANRAFMIGDWKFVIGNRLLTNINGETVRLSPTEHAFLTHMCAVENNECNKVTFNLDILGRRHFERTMRIDNFVYRLRQKLGANMSLISDEGTYRLLNVKELKPQLR